MANNPTSLPTANGLTPDIYDVSEYVNSVKQEFTPDVDEETLLLGTFGYFGYLMSSMFQNDIIMAAEFCNESIPTRARFEKNVIAHALSLNVTSLNAIPAKMEVFLTFIEDQIIEAVGGESGDFHFDCDNKLYFNQLEFHPDYDIIIRRIKLTNGKYTYVARYDIARDGVYDNPISDITNPYLNPPVVMRFNGTNYLFVACTIRQVEKSIIYKKVLGDTSLTSKTVNFEFESQLAAFDVNVTNTTTTHLVPIYEGLSTSNSKYPYVWFTYLDSKTIRIKFDRDSYSPRINSDIEIRLQTTQGINGNINWVGDYPLFTFDSERLGYSNIAVQVRPLKGYSEYGANKKSVDDLRRIIPKEALARGSITNKKDLQNFFNEIDNLNTHTYIYKKRDNNMERLYYTYMVMKDTMSNVMPTNTINLMLRPDQLYTDANRSRFILKKGKVIKLDTDKTTGFISRINDGVDVDHTDAFYYIIPYNFAICMDPMYGMYYLTTMDETKSLAFSYINEECLYQYIATAIDWDRKYLTDDEYYTMIMDVEQNISDSDEMFTFDEDGNLIDSNVRAIAVFYNKNVPIRYLEGKIIKFDRGTKIMKFEFKMKCTDYLNRYNFIRIEGLTAIGDLEGLLDYAYMPSNCKTMIHIVTKQPEYSTDLSYIDMYNTKVELGDLIKKGNLDGWNVTNSYTVNGGINFYHDFNEIIYSTIKVGEGEYIPPDEKEKDPSEIPPDYIPGGDTIQDPTSDMVLATEKAVVDLINKALREIFGYIPRFSSDENGTLYLEDHITDLTGVVASDQPTMAEGKEGEVRGWDKPEYGIPQLGELIPLPGFGWPPVLKRIKIITDEERNDKDRIFVHYTTNPDGGYDVIEYLRRDDENGNEDSIIWTNDVEEIETLYNIANGGVLHFETLIDNADGYPPYPPNKVINKGDEEDKPEDPDPEEPEEPDDKPEEPEKDPNKTTVGGLVIDPFNASDKVIATEDGVKGIVRQMIKEIFMLMPRLDDYGNGNATLKNKFGIAILGDDGDYDKAHDDMEWYDPIFPGIGDKPLDPDNPDGPVIPGTGNTIIPADDGIGYQVSPEEAKKYHFIIEDVPVVKFDYFLTEAMAQYFFRELVYRKEFIEEALVRIEDTFGINFKFVNTYGPSRLFTLDNSGRYVNRVNMTLNFRLGLQVNYEENIIQYIKDDIKSYIEQINKIDSIHMSNLVSLITEKYSESITFFEFVDMNGYGPSEQHLYSMEMPKTVITPELININTLPDQTPDINIIIA